MSVTPTKDFTHLWNDLPKDERHRLMPYEIESQVLHIWQTKQVAVRNHKRHMKELDDWMKNIVRALDGFRKESAQDKPNIPDIEGGA